LVPSSSLPTQNKPQNNSEKEAAPMRLKVGDTAPERIAVPALLVSRILRCQACRVE
jgi:hypothetical protein